MSAIPGQVACRYAKALLELGAESNTTDALVDEVSRVAAAYEASPELRSALGNPLVSYEAKRAVLLEIAEKLALGNVAKHTVLLLNDRRRVAALPAIARVLRELTDARKGLVRAEVLTAKPLSAEYIEKLRLSLERRTGKKIAIDQREDPTLIAGVIARIGDTIYDGSLRGRLDEIRAQLTS